MFKSERERILDVLSDSQPFGVKNNTLYYKRFSHHDGKGSYRHKVYCLYEYKIRNGQLSEFKRDEDLAKVCCIPLVPGVIALALLINSGFIPIFLLGFLGCLAMCGLMYFFAKLRENGIKSEMEKKWRDSFGDVPTIDELIQQQRANSDFKPKFEF